jgi:TetR/AcrR family transcriptional regulator, mexJK operon transcriptional repressor
MHLEFLDSAMIFGEKKRVIPRGEVRREQIADIAQRVFLAQGFSQTTMTAIAQAAHASKETLYRHFGSKQDLFVTIMHMKSRQIAASLDEKLDLTTAPEEVLRSTGLKLLKTLSSPEARTFLGWVIAETRRAPEIGRIYYTHGPAMVEAKLKAYFVEATKRKLLSCPDSTLATKLFLGSVIADFHLRLLSIGANDISDADICQQVDAAVSVFLAYYRVDRDHETKPEPVWF